MSHGEIESESPDHPRPSWQSALVSNFPEAVLAVNADGKIAFANAGAATLFGYPLDELAGMPVDELVPTGLRGAHEHHRASFMENPTPRPMGSGLRLQGQRRDGTSVAIDIMLNHFEGPDGEMLAVCTIRDLTDHSRREDELARANRALRVLSAGNTSLIKSHTESELVERVCKAAVDAGGYALAWIGRLAPGLDGAIEPMAKAGRDDGYITATHPSVSGPDRIGSPVSRAVRSGKPVFEREIKDGPGGAPWQAAALRRDFRAIAAFPLHDGDAVTGCFAIYSRDRDAFDWKERDLLLEMADDLAFGLRTLRERAEREANMKRVTGMLTTAERIGAVGSWDWDVVSDDSVWSDEMARIFGLGPNEAGGDLARVLALVHPDDQQRVADAIAAALAGTAPLEIRLRTVRPDGEVRHVFALGEVVRDGSGKPLQMIGSIQDVTAQEASARLREDLIDVVSHSLRTPITVIQGYAQLLASGMGDLPADQLEEIKQRIETASIRLTSLMSSVTELAKVRTDEMPPEVSPVATPDIIEAALQICEFEVQGVRERVRVVVEPEAALLLTSRRRLELVTSRVIDNALRYSPSAEEVEVRAARGASGRVVITVSDRGAGFAPGVVANLGKPFVHAEVPSAGQVAGPGLGLALAVGLTNSLGGHLEVRAREGGGSVVSLDLPGPLPAAGDPALSA